MAGYVLTVEMLRLARQVCDDARQLYRGCEVSGDVPEFEALNQLSTALDLADGLDSEDLHEVATWAREQARASNDEATKIVGGAYFAAVSAFPSKEATELGETLRRKMAKSARIVERCTDILEALAESKLPPAALLVIGSETDCEPEPAANTMMSREQVEALPSADRVALGQILATLRGEPRTAKPHEGAAVDVLVELDLYLRKLAVVLGVDEATEAPVLVDVAYQAAYDHNKWRSAAANGQADAAGCISDIAEALGLKRNAPQSRILEAAADGREHWMDQAERRRVEVERLTWKVEGYAKDVDERNQWLLEIGCALGLDAHASTEQIIAAAKTAADAEAERYALPDSHPLRSYRWGDWLDALLRREEVGASSGCWQPDPKRVEALRAARERVAMLDGDGLAGMVERYRKRATQGGGDALTEDERVLLAYASRGEQNSRIAGDVDRPLRLGSNVVPRVGGGE